MTIIVFLVLVTLESTVLHHRVFFSQLMVDGQIGRTGHYALSRAMVEHRVDLELAPIPRHSMEAKTAVEKTNKSAPATRPHAQVNNLRFILISLPFDRIYNRFLFFLLLLWFP